MPKGIFDHVFLDRPEQADDATSLYEADAAAARQAHTEYFARGVKFRVDNTTPGWSDFAAVCHEEKIESRKAPQGIKKVITRKIYSDQFQLPARRMFSEVKIDNTVYTIEEITNRSAGAVCLHLIRVSAVEATNPNHRGRS